MYVNKIKATDAIFVNDKDDNDNDDDKDDDDTKFCILSLICCQT